MFFTASSNLPVKLATVILAICKSSINAFLSEIRLHCERVFEQSVLGRLKTLSFLCVFTASLGGKSVAKTTKARASKTLRNSDARNAMTCVKPIPDRRRLAIF